MSTEVASTSLTGSRERGNDAEMTEATGKPRVVIAGGGVAGIETLLALRDLAGDRVEIEIIAPEREFTYRPLSVASPFDLGDPPRFALAEIADDLRATLRDDAVVALRPATRVALTQIGASVPYDALVVASGAEPQEAIPGAFTYRGPEDSAQLRMIVDEFQGDEQGVRSSLPCRQGRHGRFRSTNWR